MTAVRLACASKIIPGPNDFPLIYDSSNSVVLAGVAKIDVTPLSPAVAERTSRTDSATTETLDEDVNPNTGSGVPEPPRER
jgi:hypothetical protein